MITARPDTALGIVCRIVADLRPGECYKFDRYDPLLRDIPEYEHKGARFRAPDRVLGNIVGSRYTHSWREDWLDGGVIFQRHEDTGAVRYEDPDRRASQAVEQNESPQAAGFWVEIWRPWVEGICAEAASKRQAARKE